VQGFHRCDAAGGDLQVIGIRGKGAAVQLPVADQCAADIEGGMQALVQIERERIRPLDPGNQMPVVGRNRDQRADAAVDMQPQALIAAKVGNRVQIVDCAGGGAAGGGDHASRFQSLRPIRGDGFAQRIDVHPEGSIRRDPARRLAAKSKQVHRLLVAVVHLVGCIEAQRHGQVGHAFAMQIHPGHGVARHHETDDVGHGAAIDQRPARAFGKADHLAQPVGHLLVHERRSRVAHSKI
jgi:hypothetical protein